MTRSQRSICVVVNSRANYGRIRSVLGAIKDHENLELQLIVGASALLYRFGRVVDVIRKDGYEPSATLYSIVEGETPVTMAKSTGLAITELATLFENLAPDVVLTVADRFETLATAVAASYMNIALAHTQGGEVTGSIDESVRHAVTKLAHLHFPATSKAVSNVIAMGEDPQSVFHVGCPSIDEVKKADKRLPIDLFNKYGGVGPNLSLQSNYLVVLQHPVTTEYGQAFDQINQTLRALEKIQLPTVWLWPNVDAGSDDISKGLRMYREKNDPDWIHFYRNFEIDDYINLISNCACLVGNSSSGLRESAYLGTPSVNIGTRQQGRERADNVISVSYEAKEIECAIRKQLKNGRYTSSNLYGDGAAAIKIADILATHDFKIQKQLVVPISS